MTSSRRVFLFATFCALLLASPLHAAEWLLSFEVVPADDSQPYSTRAAQTAEVIVELGPVVLEAVGIDPSLFDVEVAPGGYRGRINPSVMLPLDGERDAAERVAAAFGSVFGQESVLVWREGSGDSLVGMVDMPSLTSNLADHFFRLATAMNPALGGGFSSRGNRMYFINLRGRDGKPFSGLDDAAFAQALRTVAERLGGFVTVSSGPVDARLVERDAYGALVGGQAAALERLRARRVDLLKR